MPTFVRERYSEKIKPLVELISMRVGRGEDAVVFGEAAFIREF